MDGKCCQEKRERQWMNDAKQWMREDYLQLTKMTETVLLKILLKEFISSHLQASENYQLMNE